MDIKKIDFPGVTYTVEQGELLEDEAMGLCYARQLKILLDKNLPEGAKRTTLLHEILHACLEVAGLRGDENHNEQSITTISHILVYVLQKNPELLCYLLDKQAEYCPDCGVVL